jgi:tetratricopeptide (TPR) repeat protein
MREQTYESERPYTWIVYAAAMLIIGGLAGYALSLQGDSTAAASAGATAQSSPLADENALRAYRDILARDPKNLRAAVSAGNLLYDARRYIEAIPFYQQAFALNQSDVSVSTDLGTALWYAGMPDEALAQYDRSLKIAPAHAQTLFNVGIVRAEGTHDYSGAIAAWEKLLATTPDYQNAARVRDLLADARLRINGITR